MALVVVVPLVTAFYVPTRTPLWPVAADPVPARRSAPAMVALPRNLKEVLAQLRDSVQASLRDRNSRISVETPIGFEFGVEGERVKRQGKAKMLKSSDIERSNRELARIFVGMFEGTGLVPLILFASPKEAKAAKELWDAPGFEARVQALVPAETAASAAGGAEAPLKTRAGGSSRGSGGGFGGGGGGGFGGGASKKKGNKKRASTSSRPASLTRVPDTAEVVVAVAPGEDRLKL